MRFTFAESMCDPAQYLPLAVEAERAGFHSFTVPDSLCYPEVSDSKYPYTPDGQREFLRGRPFLDPFCLIAAMGAVTERLRFTTFVVKLPIRHPVLVAKQAASVAVLTGGRFAFGVGLSPWPEDFAVTGTDWKTRGARMDEMIEIVRGLTTRPGSPAAQRAASERSRFGPGGFFAYEGEHYQVPSIAICPVPAAPIPILIGGHAEPALRRAARLGDGWMHAGGEAGDLSRLLARLRALRREAGREHEPFEVHVIALEAYTLDGVRRLEDQGVTDVIVGFRNAYEPDTLPLPQKIDALRAYADRIVAKL
ncbi:MAG: LLM class flavin-dependent oxidoreductase [Deltaproteobacteria bacterium]|nr:LLM class flavin-dependent oxidoreductase [Deltaproteobacteria bacterium]